MNFLPMLKVDSLDFGGATGIALLGFVIVLAVLSVLALFVKALSAIIGGASKKKPAVKAEKNVKTTVITPTNVAPVVPVAEAKAEETAVATVDLPYTPGYVTLDGISEQDAAVIMAITSENTGIPLERLCFKSIRRLNQDPVLENIEEQDAAVIMAIVANKLNKPIEKLCFSSIKLVEE
ncbi:MAG: OadG family protein [Clostridia bacterium]|nr:OadG family protein [Clostridia bacterium]